MRLVDAGLLDDGGGEEEERQILVEGKAVVVRQRRVSFGRCGVEVFSLAGQHGAHGRASITCGAGRQAIRPDLAECRRAGRGLVSTASISAAPADAGRLAGRPSRPKGDG